jgi:hypothetical protein
MVMRTAAQSLAPVLAKLVGRFGNRVAFLPAEVIALAFLFQDTRTGHSLMAVPAVPQLAALGQAGDVLRTVIVIVGIEIEVVYAPRRMNFEKCAPVSLNPVSEARDLHLIGDELDLEPGAFRYLCHDALLS